MREKSPVAVAQLKWEARFQQIGSAVAPDTSWRDFLVTWAYGKMCKKYSWAGSLSSLLDVHKKVTFIVWFFFSPSAAMGSDRTEDE